MWNIFIYYYWSHEDVCVIILLQGVEERVINCSYKLQVKTSMVIYKINFYL
jgi:hypothetical protein